MFISGTQDDLNGNQNAGQNVSCECGVSTSDDIVVSSYQYCGQQRLTTKSSNAVYAIIFSTCIVMDILQHRLHLNLFVIRASSKARIS
jgi:hypothetical protein